MFSGVFTALVTPFRNDRVDEEALRRLVNDQIDNGIDGLVPCGTTGESATLDVEEHLRVIKIVVAEAKKRVPVVAGTGANSTKEAIELSKAAQDAGADGMLQVTPYYNKPTQDGLFHHFKTIIEAVPLPTVLYNVPGRTACDLLPETLERLCALDKVVAVKEATGSAARAAEIIARIGDRLAVLSGDDATAFALYALGGKGCISVLSNIAPKDMSAMWDAAVAGQWNEARALHYKLFALSQGLFVESNPIPVKAALAMMGRMTEEIRPPLYPLSAKFRDKLAQQLSQAGLL
ncbi:MAG: 4-hydroxy-tetrahydrodipicolinate synthase [Myxococcales bacterium]|nr:4-hydroxy-tetrahydrodipicolinate synthase [Myxococcales bacterium]